MLLTVRSIEFDALLVSDGVTPVTDITLALLMQEAYRRCKALGPWAAAPPSSKPPRFQQTPRRAGRQNDRKDPQNQLIITLRLHRAWDRAELLMASASPPCPTGE